jgi:hypothetical protein
MAYAVEKENGLNLKKKLLTFQIMYEELDKKIRAVEGKGLKRIIVVFKLCLKEMPHLVQEIESNDPAIQKKAVVNARSLMQRVENEMETAKEEGMTMAEFNAAISDPSFFTAEEWAGISTLPKLIKKHEKLLFSSASKEKKRRPPPHTKV